MIRTRLLQGFPLAIVIITGFALRMYHLGSQSLWLDEAVTVLVANRGIPEILLYRSSIGPLDRMVLRLFVAVFGISEYSVRLPSVLAGVISIVLVYLIATCLFDKSVGLVASSILAISPFHIWYSQEARPYALLIMLSLASMWFFLTLQDRPSPSSFGGYVLTTTLALYTHVYSLFLILFQNLYLLYSWRKLATMRWKWIVAQATILVLFAPWLVDRIFFLEFKGGAPWAGFQKQVGLIEILYIFFAYSLGFSVGPSVADLHLSQSLGLFMPYMSVLVPACFVFAVPFLLGLHSMAKDKPKSLFLILYLSVPILGAFMVTQLYGRITYNVRYTAVALPAYTIILARGITSVKRKGLQELLILMIMVFSAYALGNYFFDASYAKEDSRSTAEYLETAAGERDVIVVLEITPAIEYYYDGPLEVHGISGFQLESTDSLYNELSHIARDHDKLWLVWSRPWVDPGASVKRYLDERYVVVGQEDFHGVHVYGYDLREEATPLGAR